LYDAEKLNIIDKYTQSIHEYGLDLAEK
jgi:hypothetical protein